MSACVWLVLFLSFRYPKKREKITCWLTSKIPTGREREREFLLVGRFSYNCAIPDSKTILFTTKSARVGIRWSSVVSPYGFLHYNQRNPKLFSSSPPAFRSFHFILFVLYVGLCKYARRRIHTSVPVCNYRRICSVILLKNKFCIFIQRCNSLSLCLGQ